MSRYIDVDELIRKINEHECFSYDPEVSRICELINDAPTLDVEPVVRCKDCKWYDNYEEFCHNPVWGDGHANYMPPITYRDSYCCYGERKDGRR